MSSFIKILDSSAVRREQIFDLLETCSILYVKCEIDNLECIVNEITSWFSTPDSTLPGHTTEEYGPLLPWHIDGIYQDVIPDFVALICYENKAEGGNYLI